MICLKCLNGLRVMFAATAVIVVSLVGFSGPARAQNALSVGWVSGSSRTALLEYNATWNGYNWNYTYYDTVVCSVDVSNILNATDYCVAHSIIINGGRSIKIVVDEVDSSTDNGTTWSSANSASVVANLGSHNCSNVYVYTSSLFSWSARPYGSDDEHQYPISVDLQDPMGAIFNYLGVSYGSTMTTRVKYHYVVEISYNDGTGNYTLTGSTNQIIRTNFDGPTI